MTPCINGNWREVSNRISEKRMKRSPRKIGEGIFLGFCPTYISSGNPRINLRKKYFRTGSTRLERNYPQKIETNLPANCFPKPKENASYSMPFVFTTTIQGRTKSCGMRLDFVYAKMKTKKGC